MTDRGRRADGEQGSALVIALFFVAVFSLFVASVISFAEVGLRASKSFDEEALSVYATDGAVEAAINQFREGGPCGDYTAPRGPDGAPLYGRGVIVRCEDDDVDRPTSGTATKPRNALLSLGNEGISTVGEQRVLGNIFSNSTVEPEGKLIVQGQVSAIGNCGTPPDPPDIETFPEPNAVHCLNTDNAADPSQGRDPDYTAASSTVPVRRTPPPCPAGWLVEIEPGYYDDAGALSAFTAAAGSCPGKVVWLKPGNYYLDFTFLGGAGTWTVDDPNVVVVAGTPKGWDPAAPARPPALTGPGVSVPGTCKTGDDPGLVDGVQLVAGGGSHLRITKGQVELCAEPNPADQSIALYGMASSERLPGLVHSLVPTNWAAGSGFSSPGNATTIGEGPARRTADVELQSSGPTSASVTFNAFRPGVADGSLIDSAVLRVVHKDVGDLDPDSVKVEVAFPGSTCEGEQALPVRTTFQEDRIDLKACGLTNPAALAGVTVTYSVALASGGSSATDNLDGVAVDVTYRTPTTGKPTVVTAVSGFASPGNALEIGEQPAPLTADATLSSAGPTTASITLTGLGDPPIPPASVIDSAVLRVAHRDQGQMAAPTVTVPLAGGTCTAMPLPLRPAGIVDDRLDLKACGLDSPTDLAGLTVSYAVSLDSGADTATANLDGMWLELVYSLTHSPATVTPTVFINPDNAKVIDATTADATLSSTGPTSASLILTPYDQPVVPAGSVIDSAVLRVAHHDLGSMDRPTLAVDGIGPCSPVLTRRPAALGEDRIDLKACGLDNPAELAGLSVTYTANLTAGPDATALVDGVVLELVYRPPAVRRPDTATTTSPGFSDPDNAKIIDESPTALTADATVAAGGPSVSLTVDDFNRIPLSPGSLINSAVLRVAHQDDEWMSTPTLAVAFPGSTCSPALTKQAPVRGEDRIDLKACGLTRADQLAALAATYTAHSPNATVTEEPANSASTTFSGHENAKAIGEQPPAVATAAIDSDTTPSASIVLSGYAQPAVPANSTLTGARLRVVHMEDPGAATAATVSFTGGTCTQTFEPRSTLGEDTIDLMACGLNDLAQVDGLSVDYQATVPTGATTGTAVLDGIVLDVTYEAPSGTTRLDGIELEVVFRPPALRPLDGCLTAGPYPPVPPVPLPPEWIAPCALVTVAPAPLVAGEPLPRFAAQGTIYAPSAALDISMNGLTDQVLSRGLVGRTIRLGLKAAAGYNRPLAGVPPEPVTFTAYPDVTARATAASSLGDLFADPENAREIREEPTTLFAQADIDDITPQASLELSSYVKGAPLADGSVIDAAVLRIVHREGPRVGTVEVTVGGFAAGPCAQDIELTLYPESGDWGEDQIDLTPCGLTDPAQLSTLTITYTVKLADGETTTTSAYLDGITLDLLSGPLLRARVGFDASQDTVHVQGWSVLR